MEPGRDDREEVARGRRVGVTDPPLWSPVVTTGKRFGPDDALVLDISRYGARS